MMIHSNNQYSVIIFNLSPDGFLVFATVALAFGLLSWGQLIFKNIIDLPYLRWTLTQFFF